MLGGERDRLPGSGKMDSTAYSGLLGIHQREDQRRQTVFVSKDAGNLILTVSYQKPAASGTAAVRCFNPSG